MAGFLENLVYSGIGNSLRNFRREAGVSLPREAGVTWFHVGYLNAADDSVLKSDQH